MTATLCNDLSLALSSWPNDESKEDQMKAAHREPLIQVCANLSLTQLQAPERKLFPKYKC